MTYERGSESPFNLKDSWLLQNFLQKRNNTVICFIAIVTTSNQLIHNSIGHSKTAKRELLFIIVSLNKC